MNPADGKRPQAFPGERTTEVADSASLETRADTGELPTDPSASDFGAQQDNSSPRPPWWMYLVAIPFLAKAVFITGFCFFGPQPSGIEARPTKTHPVVSSVTPGSPAERAGIQAGDVLLRANGQPIPDANYGYWFLTNVEIGRPFVLDLDRHGQYLRSVLQLKQRPTQFWFTREGSVLLLNLSGVFLALAVAGFLAFMRPTHLLACIGALFLAVYSTGVFTSYDGLNSAFRHWPFWYQVVLWIANVLSGLGLGVWFTFFALFPRPSFHSRWIWAIAWAPISLASLLLNYQVWHFVYSPVNMIPSGWMSGLFAACWVTYLPGSFAMLAIKYRRLNDGTEKRRVRLFVFPLAFVIFLAVPSLVYRQPEYSGSPGASFFLSLPVLALATLAGVTFPLSFAYAILRHRLFGIRIIIRQGIRYAAAKRLLLLAAPAIIVVFLADLYAHRDRRIDMIIVDRGWIYPGLAGLAILAHARRRRWLHSLDRRFFREQYNAQAILRSTLSEMKTAGTLVDVAPLVVKQIGAAMHPSFCAMLEYCTLDKAYTAVSVFPDAFPMPALPAQSKVIELVNLINKPVHFGEPNNWVTRQLDRPELERVRHLGIEMLAPIGNRKANALIVLGAKRSEEPYTSEDLRLIEDLAIGLSLLPSSSPRKETKPEISRECPTCRKCHDFTDEFCFHDGSKLIMNPYPLCLGDRFKLEFRIGQGGMGKVYEAIDEQLGRKVAVKLILQDWIRDSAALERFGREARLLANFQHPNVVTLFDAGLTSGGHPFLVMERLRGRTLREELNSKTRLPHNEVRSLVRQLCAAVSAAHRRSLIHRDLKPENIFLCDDGLSSVLKVLDFGLATLIVEALDSTQGRKSATRSGQIAGTPAYMAPELLSGAKVDCGCDIWATAVVTFEMLTGHLPSFTNSGALMDSSVGELPMFWRDFFKLCLSHEPSERPESIDIFLECLDKCVE
jgi:Protein kinase domain/PDZ domain